MAILDAFNNLVKVTVSTGYGSGDAVIVLTTGLGAKLPIPPFNATWWNSTDYGDPSDDPNVEIIRIITVSGDTLGILRAQENTLASTKNTATKTYSLIAGVTALTMTAIANALFEANDDLDDLTTAIKSLAMLLALEGFDIPEELSVYLD